jgi:hypothetical protein
MILPDQQVLLKYLDPYQPFEFMSSLRYSTLLVGLRDCRAYTKRDIQTGSYDSGIAQGDEGNWLATIGYFTILDQLGSCYKPIGEPEPAGNANTIKFAIEKFAYDMLENDDKKLNALIGLRNAFTHDFNLLNIPRDSRMVWLQQHKFTVTVDTANSWIVKLPSRLWDGNIDGKNFYDNSDSTFVNLFGIGNLAETIYSKITLLNKANGLELRMPLIRLINKYTFVISQ